MESSFTTRKDLIKRKASGWYFWGAVVAVAFPGPYGPETGYDPKDTTLLTITATHDPSNSLAPSSSRSTKPQCPALPDPLNSIPKSLAVCKAALIFSADWNEPGAQTKTWLLLELVLRQDPSSSSTVLQLLRTVQKPFQTHPSLQNPQKQLLCPGSCGLQKSLGFPPNTQPPLHFPQEASQLPAFTHIVPPTSTHGSYSILPSRLRHNNHVEPVDTLSLPLTKALLQSITENTNAYAVKQLEESKQSEGRKWGEMAPGELSLWLGIVMYMGACPAPRVKIIRVMTVSLPSTQPATT